MSVMLTSSMVKLAYHLTVIGLSQLLKVLRTRPPLIVSSSGTLVFGHIRFYMVRKMNQLLPNRMSYSCRLAHPLEWCHFSLFQVDPLGYSGPDSQSFFHHFFFSNLLICVQGIIPKRLKLAYFAKLMILAFESHDCQR